MYATASVVFFFLLNQCMAQWIQSAKQFQMWHDHRPVYSRMQPVHHFLKKRSFQRRSVISTIPNIPKKQGNITPFIVDLECSSSRVINGRKVCDLVEFGIKRAFLRLAKVIYLPETCRIEAKFCDPSACGFDTGSLARANPIAWFTFSKQVADKVGLDSSYMYPSSLARQYVPNDQVFASSTKADRVGYYDISITFNAEMNWWFADPEIDKFGEYLQPIKDPGSTGYKTGKLYDFEQIAVHELLHGLGFISSWYKWMPSEELLMPGALETDDNRIITGFEPSYLFDRNLMDSSSQKWMSDYARILREAARNTSISFRTTDPTLWMRQFLRTPGGSLLQKISTQILNKPQNVLYFYPKRRKFETFDKTLLTKDDVQRVIGTLQNTTRDGFMSIDFGFAVIYTPSTYSPGSSCSHLDSQYYEGTTEFVMRPFGTPGVGMDGFNPKGSNGPIGRVTLGILRAMGYATALGPL